MHSQREAEKAPGLSFLFNDVFCVQVESRYVRPFQVKEKRKIWDTLYKSQPHRGENGLILCDWKRTPLFVPVTQPFCSRVWNSRTSEVMSDFMLALSGFGWDVAHLKLVTRPSYIPTFPPSLSVLLPQVLSNMQKKQVYFQREKKAIHL